MTTVTLKQMQDKLISLDTLTRVLQKTEPISRDHISSDSKVQFRLGKSWAEGIEAMAPEEGLDAALTIDGTERQLTKGGLLQAAGKVGLSSAYIRSHPSHLIEGLLNYDFGSGMGESEYSVLSVADKVSAFTRPTVVPFSNLQLLESAVEGIRQRRGDVPIFADYKVGNTLKRTDIRLIIPGEERVMQDTGMDDVPEGKDDVWLSGLHISNSLTGESQTALEAYMFRWWCTNGATTTLEGVGSWNRKIQGQQDDVYAWARDQVDSILGGLEYRFDQVQALTQLDVTGNLNDIMLEIFRQYEVPVSQRNAVAARLERLERLTMYGIMQAITEVANEHDMEDRRRDRLMRIGGAIPTETFDTLKAKVWREGHAADAEARNPYEIRVTAAVG